MHPRKNEGSSRGVDVYALGVLLLEIGLWKNMDGVVDLRTLFEEEGVGEEGWERVRREFLSLTGRLDGFVFFFSFFSPSFSFISYFWRSY